MTVLRATAQAFMQKVGSLSGIGLTLGALFFAAALTPTLVPRTAVTQGALAGACLALGYLTGVLCRWLWRYLELPEPPSRMRFVVNAVITIACVLVVAVSLWQATEWQNSIRAVMNMTPVETARPFKTCGVAVITFLVLLMLARLFTWLAGFLSGYIRRLVPRKLANVLAVLGAAVLFWSFTTNVVIRTAFDALDLSFREFDALIEPERPQPLAPGKTGSAASLVRWRELGRAGREFVASGPGAAEISALTGRPAHDPIRVYVGLRGGETARERAKLALDELKRQGGFDRAALIVITPTGTGWIDPSAMAPIEYLLDGDVASVAVQYSYLNSPLSLLFQPEYGAEAARALFAEIYAHWTALPKVARPKLYLHGLSLGAMNSERSAELFEIIGDPIAGALWSGPPFPSRTWRAITARRYRGSPAWLPEFRDGRLVRFMNQNGMTISADAPWGPMRVVYLQYASDPIIFFDYQDAFRSPDWMKAPRGPDVSPSLRWYPLVTMLQLGLDLAVATSPPMGYGHTYAPEHYVDAWVAVADVRNWSPEALARLKDQLGKAARARSESTTDDNPYADRGG